MISHKLKQRVLEEATLLKQYATPEELNRLDGAKIEPYWGLSCIYGIITGDCYSERAHELLSKCAVWPYSIWADKFIKTSMGVKRWMSLRKKYKEGYSPIEYYIIKREEKIPVLVDYLLGKRELKIEDL